MGREMILRIMPVGGDVQMPKCVYCGKVYEFPKGITLIGVDGKINHLCSSKCRKNKAMKRRKVRWISKRKESKKEMLDEIKAEAAEEHVEKVEVAKESKKEEKKEVKEKAEKK